MQAASSPSSQHTLDAPQLTTMLSYCWSTRRLHELVHTHAASLQPLHVVTAFNRYCYLVTCMHAWPLPPAEQQQMLDMLADALMQPAPPGYTTTLPPKPKRTLLRTAPRRRAAQAPEPPRQLVEYDGMVLCADLLMPDSVRLLLRSCALLRYKQERLLLRLQQAAVQHMWMYRVDELVCCLVSVVHLLWPEEELGRGDEDAVAEEEGLQQQPAVGPKLGGVGGGGGDEDEGEAQAGLTSSGPTPLPSSGRPPLPGHDPRFRYWRRRKRLPECECVGGAWGC